VGSKPDAVALWRLSCESPSDEGRTLRKTAALKSKYGIIPVYTPLPWRIYGDSALANALTGKRIAILATDGFEQVELTEPKKNLEDAGATVTVLSVKATPDEIKSWDKTDWGKKIKVDGQVSEADPAQFDALVLPGGQMNPDKLRIDHDAVSFVKRFVATGKTTAAICHGPWVLIEANVVKAKTMTSWPSVHTDLKNAGANWVNQEVVVDGQFITSRKPEDIPAFSREIIKALS
jgi:protease I